MHEWALRLLKIAYIGLIAALPVAAVANYTATVGTGTNFGSFDVGGVKFPGFVISDPTTPTQGASVSAGGAVKVDNSAVTQPVSSTTLSTKANQDTNSATTAHTCSVAGYSELGCLGQIDDDVKTGASAIGAAIPAGAIYAAGQARSSEQSAASNGNLNGFITDLAGKLIVLPYANPENFGVGQITSAMTGTTSTALTGMGAPGASLRWYITSCTVSNSHATVGTMVNLQDGSGGATLWQFPAAPAYGGAAPPFPTPIRQPTTNTGVFAVNATTGSSTLVSCTGYKGA